MQRCWWCGDDPLYVAYHDNEWGTPVTDDQRLFEKLCLEGFQAGLSWITILRKRENFRAAFDGFEIKKITKYTDQDVARLMQDEGIVRHRGKIESVINNAHRALEMQNEFGSLTHYFWSFEPKADERPTQYDAQTLKALGKSATSLAISKDLKKRGWSFVGPTTVYSFMQAMGMVNDHVQECHRRAIVDKARKALKRP